MGSDLDQGVDARLSHRADRGLEEHRLAQVVEPVLGAHLGGVGGLAGDGRVDRDLAGARLDPGERGEQLLAGRLDLRGVARVAHPDPPGAHPVGLKLGLELIERLGVTGDDH